MAILGVVTPIPSKEIDPMYYLVEKKQHHISSFSIFFSFLGMGNGILSLEKYLKTISGPVVIIPEE